MHWILFVAVFLIGCGDSPDTDELPSASAGGGVGPGALVPPAGEPESISEPGGEPKPLGAVDPAGFVAEIDHLYLPLAPGSYWVYEGAKAGADLRVEATVATDPMTILGVSCTEVAVRESLNGVLVEVTTYWYAQDKDGNVWMFGEEAAEIQDGVVAQITNAWEAGVDGAPPSMKLPADPRVGEIFFMGGPDDLDQVEVLSVSDSVTGPMGNFEDCLRTTEAAVADPDDPDEIIYAPGVGPVSEQSIDTSANLIEHGRR